MIIHLVNGPHTTAQAAQNARYGPSRKSRSFWTPAGDTNKGMAVLTYSPTWRGFQHVYTIAGYGDGAWVSIAEGDPNHRYMQGVSALLWQGTANPAFYADLIALFARRIASQQFSPGVDLFAWAWGIS